MLFLRHFANDDLSQDAKSMLFEQCAFRAVFIIIYIFGLKGLPSAKPGPPEEMLPAFRHHHLTGLGFACDNLFGTA